MGNLVPKAHRTLWGRRRGEAAVEMQPVEPVSCTGYVANADSFDSVFVVIEKDGTMNPFLLIEDHFGRPGAKDGEGKSNG